jgi:hypothetical protein
VTTEASDPVNALEDIQYRMDLIKRSGEYYTTILDQQTRISKLEAEVGKYQSRDRQRLAAIRELKDQIEGLTDENDRLRLEVASMKQEPAEYRPGKIGDVMVTAAWLPGMPDAVAVALDDPRAETFTVSVWSDDDGKPVVRGCRLSEPRRSRSPCGRA